MLKVPKAVVDSIVEQARKEAPLECCGILAGRDGKVIRCYPTTNAEKSNTTYLIDSHELFEIHRSLRDEGLEILSIYHSHTVPNSRAYPSATDISRAFWEGTDMETYPGCVYLIIGLAETSEPVLRGFQIPDRTNIKEVPIAIIDKGNEGE